MRSVHAGIFVTLVCCTLTLHAQGPGTHGKETQGTYQEIRQKVWATTPASAGITVRNEVDPWGFVMDFGIGDNTYATLVVMSNRTVNLYLSSGGGFLGSGNQLNVWQAAQKLLLRSREYVKQFKPASNFTLPGNEKLARIYLFTKTRKYQSVEFNPDLLRPDDKLGDLFSLANDVITEIRVATGN